MFGAALAAVRAAGDGECGELASATRVRVRRSLEGHARSRHRMMRFGTVMAVLLVSTVSWALSTGRIPLFVSRPTTPAVIAPTIDPPALPQREPAPLVRRVAVPEAAWPTPPTDTVEPAPPPPPPLIVKRPPRQVAIETMYRKAHVLHFHGADDVAALAAWDAYLAAEPSGRFAVEARYNRALILVRLARYADARAALAPFADGDVAPAGYRKAEAAQLVERLDALIAGDR